MRCTLKLTAVLLMGCLSAFLNGAEPVWELKDVLPNQTVDVEILDLEFTPRAAELGKKLAESMARDRQWFMEYTRDNAKSGEALPYHSKFGLTADEYQEFLAEAKKERKLIVVGRAKLNFMRSNDVVTIDGGLNSPISRMRIDLKTNHLSSSVGDVGIPSWRSSDRTDIPIGPYEGYSWKFEAGELNSLDVTLFSLDIYRRRENAKVFCRYKDGVIEKGNAKRKVDVMFQFDLPQQRTP